jgi:hypothetical protein
MRNGFHLCESGSEGGYSLMGEKTAGRKSRDTAHLNIENNKDVFLQANCNARHGNNINAMSIETDVWQIGTLQLYKYTVFYLNGSEISPNIIL